MKYYIITYGCQMNKSDSERMAAQLEGKGYQLAQQVKEADLVVLNVCSVRQSAINRVYSKVKQIRSQKQKAKIILTGCLLEKDKKQLARQVDEIWPIVDLEIKPKYQSRCQVFVPIMTGCNNFCSYCVVPYARGQEYSRPAQEIIKEIKNLVNKGYQEITLLGQNVNSYQDHEGLSLRDSPCFKDCPLGTVPHVPLNFPNLLKTIHDIPGNFQIKFLTSHPKDMSDELIKVISQSKKISQEIHLPVQSGDNQILKKMNRGYTINHYKKLIKKIRQQIPQAKISTDIIVGFPNETEKQFQKTVNLVKEIGFKQAYVSVYSPRVGTAAAKLKDNVSSNEKKRRKRILLDIFETHPQKLIVILGPTASGKSDLAIKLVKKFNGEIVSADSRQIYQEIDIGTGKIEMRGTVPKGQSLTLRDSLSNIPHYLIDIVKPNQEFTLAQYKKLSIKAIKDIQKRGKLPFLVGGTGLYIQAVIDNLQIPKVKPNKKLRNKLEKLSNQELFKQLKKLDPLTAATIDPYNKRRLIRALEVCLITKKPFSEQRKKGQPLFDVCQIGLKLDKKTLEKRIDQRVDKMFKAGLVEEVKKLAQKYSFDLPAMSGIGYQEIGQYLQGEITLGKAKELIKQHSRQYARRQLSWFKRDKRINWVSNYQKARKAIADFL